MSYNLAAASGSAQVRLFNIRSNNNRDVNIASGFGGITIYSSCLDNSVRVSCNIVDTGYRDRAEGVSAIEQNDLNLTAGERASLIIEDGFGNKISFLDDYHLRLQRVGNITQNVGNNIFNLEFYSEESINNELVDYRVKGRHNGKLSDSVFQIMTETLKTKKSIFIDETLNEFNFLGNNEKPFYKIPWLGKRSVPNIPNAVGRYAGYFFYETPDDGTGRGGYHFRSIDKFFSQKPKQKLIYTNTPYIPEGYNKKILSYSISSSVNLDTSLKVGALSGSITRNFNPLNSNYNESKFSDFDRMINETYMGGKDLIPAATDLNLFSKASRIHTKWLPVGVLPSGTTLEKQIENSEKIDWNFDQIIPHAVARYNNLFNTRLNIVIAGDLSINAGDIIECDFPEVSSRVSKIISNKHSGKYLVIDAAHQLAPDKRLFTSLNLVRESIYKY